MTPSHHYDPVSALSEAEATGRTAEIFADIREAMQIPLITSIWRGLAGIEGALEPTWAAVRPIMLSGQPDRALFKLIGHSKPPMPDTLSPDWPVTAGMSIDDARSALAIIRAYNRSNGLNLVALTALVNKRTSESAAAASRVEHIPWPELPTLLEKDEIEPSTWALLERIKHLGADGEDSALATLWRHLAHWPRLLEQVIAGYEPMQQDGRLQNSILEMMERVKDLSGEIDASASDLSTIPAPALETIESYVHQPFAVNRMVAIGHGLQFWLDSGIHAGH